MTHEQIETALDDLLTAELHATAGRRGPAKPITATPLRFPIEVKSRKAIDAVYPRRAAIRELGRQLSEAGWHRVCGRHPASAGPALEHTRKLLGGGMAAAAVALGTGGLWAIVPRPLVPSRVA